ncbi:MAG: hypothetical protein U0800_02325 [Isosphaeraceae bacterium]
MGTPMKPRRTRAITPATEALEVREMLSRVVTGIDADGDRWKLAIHGPGEFRVTTQNNVPTKQGGLINTITVAGGRTLQTRLVGNVRKGPNGDGKVFFQNLVTLNNPPVPDVNGIIRTNLDGRGMAAIDIPGFYLGDTSKGTFVPATGSPTGRISVPTGVTSLRFGGVDTRAFAQPATRAVTFQINLGLPQYLGTSIITDTVTSSNRTSTDGTTALNDTVDFNIQGRLNIFQANAINGADTPPTGRYQGNNTGGTTISDGPDANGTTGQIGNIQINGNATNLTVEVPLTTPTGATVASEFALITNFYIGGETNKVSVTAPGGLRNVAFGKGMDTVSINTESILHLVANRGAIGSTVIANGPITLVNIGGDVTNSQVLSGYFPSGSAANPTIDVGAGGRMTVTVAGDITDSLFAASAIPLNADGTVSVDGRQHDPLREGLYRRQVRGQDRQRRCCRWPRTRRSSPRPRTWSAGRSCRPTSSSRRSRPPGCTRGRSPSRSAPAGWASSARPTSRATTSCRSARRASPPCPNPRDRRRASRSPRSPASDPAAPDWPG